jgi:hypothetical protein
VLLVIVEPFGAASGKVQIRVQWHRVLLLMFLWGFSSGGQPA